MKFSRKDTCYFCKKRYEGYVVLLCAYIECFIMEMNYIKEIYYDNERNIGICESCRDKHFHKNPVFMIRAWLFVRAQLILSSSAAGTDSKKKYDAALKRIDKYEKRLEKTPEVQKLYRENNPAAYKKLLKVKTDCHYCGENYGSKWVNDPNKMEPTEDTSWWVCIPCSKVIPLQEELSWACMGLNMAEKNNNKKGIAVQHSRVERIEKKIKEIAYEDQMEVCSFEFIKTSTGYKSRRRM